MFIGQKLAVCEIMNNFTLKIIIIWRRVWEWNNAMQ